MLPYLHIGKISLPSYGVLMALGIIVAVLISYIRLKKNGETFDSLLLVGAITMLLALFGAVFAYFAFSYGLKRLFLELFSGDFSALENVGMVYYGGLIGGVIGAIAAVLINKFDFTVFSDAMVPALPIGHAFGRIGCLLAGCCYGLPYDGVLAVHSAFVDSAITLFPIQAVESAANILMFLVLTIYVNRNSDRKHNTLVAYLFLYSIERFVIEIYRGDSIRGIFYGLSSSQWISIAIFAVVLIRFAVLRIKDRNACSAKECG